MHRTFHEEAFGDAISALLVDQSPHEMQKFKIETRLDLSQIGEVLFQALNRTFLGSDEKYLPYATCLKTKSCVPSALQARAA